ncbi:hypothetical protein [Streptomyces radiopugnans]|uniref:hypothetical protein n=1 Tax=Streptomyces radiopugnans TaxID=403935 RepID=UPI003F1BE4C6
MTDRRPLGTGTDRADASRPRDTDPVPAPRAQLAAERLPAVPVALVPAEQKTAPLARRRALGAGVEGLPAPPSGG